jgi:hypothetical protein
MPILIAISLIGRPGRHIEERKGFAISKIKGFGLEKAVAGKPK